MSSIVMFVLIPNNFGSVKGEISHQIFWVYNDIHDILQKDESKAQAKIELYASIFDI